MPLFRGFQTFALDVITGVLAFVAFYVTLQLLPDNHASITFLLAETIYFVAGLLARCGSLRTTFLRVLFIVVPGAGTILALAYTGYAFTAHFYIFFFFVAALSGTLFGILLRRFFVRRSTTFASLVAAGIVAVNLLAVHTVIPRTVSAELGKEADLIAPSFSFSTIDGGIVSSAQLQGKVVLLAFWATWCRPCIGELRRVQQVYDRYRFDSRVVIWVIDSGISNDTVAKQRKMIAAEHWDLPFAQDSENLEFKMGLHGLPKLVLLDKTGRVRWLHDGFDASEDLAGEISRQIDSLLGGG